eukprot:scaffold156110_cov18-Tisochrysis_lutea.AAC.1
MMPLEWLLGRATRQLVMMHCPVRVPAAVAGCKEDAPACTVNLSPRGTAPQSSCQGVEGPRIHLENCAWRNCPHAPSASQGDEGAWKDAQKEVAIAAALLLFMRQAGTEVMSEGKEDAAIAAVLGFTTEAEEAKRQAQKDKVTAIAAALFRPAKESGKLISVWMQAEEAKRQAQKDAAIAAALARAAADYEEGAAKIKRQQDLHKQRQAEREAAQAAAQAARLQFPSPYGGAISPGMGLGGETHEKGLFAPMRGLGK